MRDGERGQSPGTVPWDSVVTLPSRRVLLGAPQITPQGALLPAPAQVSCPSQTYSLLPASLINGSKIRFPYEEGRTLENRVSAASSWSRYG